MIERTSWETGMFFMLVLYLYRMLHSSVTKNPRSLGSLIVILAALVNMSGKVGFAQQSSLSQSGSATIQGTVVDAAGNPVTDASVFLEQKDRSEVVKTRTNPNGVFVFSTLQAGAYRIHSEKLALRSRIPEALVLAEGEQKHIDLVLEVSGAVPSSAEAMAFADQPTFTVAGVTDWTAAGGHGSDVSLRTSEELARETLVLKPEDSRNTASSSIGSASTTNESESRLRAALAKEPGSFSTNHQLGAFYLHAGRYSEAVPLLQASYRLDPSNYDNEYDLALACKGVGDFSKARDHVQNVLAHKDNAGLHRLLGDLDEELGDSLAAVREDEKAVRLDPSEQNYFEWGSELLLHRAIQPAIEVFGNGSKAHPKSVRMLAALGAALFASGLYDEAALRVCDASSLNPADSAPYIFLGKIQIAASSPLSCVEPKLAQFVQQQPGNAFANYYYAMAIWKDQKSSENSRAVQQVEALLTKSVAIDPKFDDAYLQLGILYSSEGDFKKAADFYAKAIAVNPLSSAAHYRLGMAYARIGERGKSKQEFQLHDELDKQQAAEIERQRKEIKQFLVILKAQQTSAVAN